MEYNRAQRRMKHKLIEKPNAIFPIRGLILSKSQKKWGCICNTGWLSISIKKPIESFDQHVQQFNK